MKPKNKIVLLLTGTIIPNSLDILKVSDPEIRKRQYIDTISFYLSETKFPIVFAENSGTSIMEYFEGENRIEFLTYSAAVSKPERGKGWKEMKIIDYAIKNSDFINHNTSIIKVTGRLQVVNIRKLLKQGERLRADSPRLVLSNIYQKFKMDSRCFFFTPDFWPLLKKNGRSINLSYSLERALWKAVCEYDLIYGGNYRQFTEPLRIKGVSGGLGVAYKHGILITIARKIRHLFMLHLIYHKFRKTSI